MSEGHSFQSIFLLARSDCVLSLSVARSGHYRASSPVWDAFLLPKRGASDAVCESQHLNLMLPKGQLLEDG